MIVIDGVIGIVKAFKIINCLYWFPLSCTFNRVHINYMIQIKKCL